MGKSRAEKPTREQKAILTGAGFVWKNWLVVSEDKNELHVVNKSSGHIRRLKKPPTVKETRQRHTK